MDTQAIKWYDKTILDITRRTNESKADIKEPYIFNLCRVAPLDESIPIPGKEYNRFLTKKAATAYARKYNNGNKLSTPVLKDHVDLADDSDGHIMMYGVYENNLYAIIQSKYGNRDTYHYVSPSISFTYDDNNITEIVNIDEVSLLDTKAPGIRSNRVVKKSNIEYNYEDSKWVIVDELLLLDILEKTDDLKTTKVKYSMENKEATEKEKQKDESVPKPVDTDYNKKVKKDNVMDEKDKKIDELNKKVEQYEVEKFEKKKDELVKKIKTCENYKLPLNIDSGIFTRDNIDTIDKVMDNVIESIETADVKKKEEQEQKKDNIEIEDKKENKQQELI